MAMKVGILTSGDLGMNTLIKIINNFNVVFVLTDGNSHGVLSLCKENKIPCFKGNPRNGVGYDFIKKIEVDIIASINYLFLIEKDIIHHSKQITFNLHGSLLPKYRGRTPHVWSIINNEKETGITTHVIDEGCDTGDIISQTKIKIDKFHTGNDILNKYKILYYNLVKEVIEKVKSEQLKLKKQDENLATYFGVRRPGDGRIDWNWQKERIRNWVRAQSYPYPGAFTFFNGQKITIDKVEESYLGFNYNIINGTILEVKPNLIIKTQNGALIIKDYREKIQFIKGEKLGDYEK
jgi:methionyl-tRNA formyltransferase